MAVSLPAIARSLGASFTSIVWVISAYLLSYASLLMGAGAYADLKGRKKAMLIGLIVFAMSSAAYGAASSSWVLNVGRAFQGIGGALLLTAALAIITNTFTGLERAHAFAVWGACLGIALTLGPILGGVITNFLGWRWVFFVNVPACAALILATLAVIQESRDPQSQKLLDRRLALSSLTRRKPKRPQTFSFFSRVSENGPRAQGFAFAAQPQRVLDRSGPFSEIFWLRRERWNVEKQKQHQQQTKRRAI